MICDFVSIIKRDSKRGNFQSSREETIKSRDINVGMVFVMVVSPGKGLNLVSLGKDLAISINKEFNLISIFSILEKFLI